MEFVSFELFSILCLPADHRYGCLSKIGMSTSKKKSIAGSCIGAPAERRSKRLLAKGDAEVSGMGRKEGVSRYPRTDDVTKTEIFHQSGAG